MSHRSALLLSLAFTMLVGFAIVTNRDQLLGANAGEANSGVTATAVVSTPLERGMAASQGDPRIIEVTLPVGTQSELVGNALGDDSDRFDSDHDREEREYDDHDDDHEEDDHEDDEDDEDDDDD